MKVSAHVLLLACLTCTLAVPALAADGSPPAPVPAAQPLATPAGVNCSAPSTEQPLDEVLFASSGPQSNATCTADCYPFADVSCSTSGSCTAVDRNCPNQRGYVKCGTSYTFCPVCPCPEGHHRYVFTGNCCDCGQEERSHAQCINGQWEFIDIVCWPNTGPCPFCP